MSSPNQDSMIGRVIGGRFEIIRLIGQGGMGAVFEARHQTLPRKFAIKILRPELARSHDFVERFRREAIASGRIQHPNIIYITDFGTMEDGCLYLVMEYLEGEGLDQVLSRTVRLPLSRALPILAQVADALDAAHQVGVVHRDLKPENILLSEVRGRKDVVKIFDFGIARVQTPEYVDEALTAKGQVFGTAEYMSPEQATGEDCDGRSDLYAVGCLAYELSTGDPPFTGQPVRVLQAHVSKPVAPPSTRLKDHPVPPAFDALVLRCLAKDPKDRYQSGAELRQDLLKVRGLLYSMGAQIAERRHATGRMVIVSEKHMTEGWRSLGGQAPEFFSSGADPVMTAARFMTAGQAPVANLDQLHADYHEALRELAIALVRAILAPAETSQQLEQLLAVEEDIASLTGTIALAEQNFDRIRYEEGQREKRLRYAMFDLSMERAQLEGRAKADPSQTGALQQQISDLDFQIGELSKSTEDVDRDRALQIADLDREVQRYRDARRQREEESQKLYQKLHAQVEALRPAVSDSKILAIYDRLATVRSKLEQVR
ncbi:MAG: protein kinase [Deltaproteobacteria bacterium]|nr:protein kinase [Deltaproteobacteria bacterium]